MPLGKWHFVCILSFLIPSAKRKPLIWLPCGGRMLVRWASGKILFPKFQDDASVLAVAWPVYTSSCIFMGWIRDLDSFSLFPWGLQVEVTGSVLTNLHSSDPSDILALSSPVLTLSCSGVLSLCFLDIFLPKQIMSHTLKLSWFILPMLSIELFHQCFFEYE